MSISKGEAFWVINSFNFCSWKHCEAANTWQCSKAISDRHRRLQFLVQTGCVFLQRPNGNRIPSPIPGRLSFAKCSFDTIFPKWPCGATAPRRIPSKYSRIHSNISPIHTNPHPTNSQRTIFEVDGNGHSIDSFQWRVLVLIMTESVDPFLKFRCFPFPFFKLHRTSPCIAVSNTFNSNQISPN